MSEENVDDKNTNDKNANDDNEFDPAPLQRLRDLAKTLPADVAPNVDSWAAIRDRIESSRVLALPNVSGERLSPFVAQVDRAELVSPIRFRTTRVVLLAAATLFAAVTTAVVMRERGEPALVARSSTDSNAAVNATVASAPTPAPIPPAAAIVARDTSVAVARAQLDAPIVAILAQYNAAANDLVKDFDARRGRLQPDALAVVDSCLHTLDQAIRESREALTATPGNTTIIELLQVTYQQKLDLLRRTADLPTVSLQD